MLIGLAGIFAALFLKRPAANPNPPSAPATETVPQPGVPKMAAVSNPEPAATNPAVAPAPVVAGTNGDTSAHDAYVRAHLDRLTELQANDDPASLHEILGELTNSEKVIRAGRDFSGDSIRQPRRDSRADQSRRASFRSGGEKGAAGRRRFPGAAQLDGNSQGAPQRKNHWNRPLIFSCEIRAGARASFRRKKFSFRLLLSAPVIL